MRDIEFDTLSEVAPGTPPPPFCRQCRDYLLGSGEGRYCATCGLPEREQAVAVPRAMSEALSGEQLASRVILALPEGEPPAEAPKPKRPGRSAARVEG
ncbi:MAG TPA: hypothetical protein VF526_15440 [Solirubrobacteraceae bacterium]|jgi:hypothetical protein